MGAIADVDVNGGKFCKAIGDLWARRLTSDLGAVVRRVRCATIELG